MYVHEFENTNKFNSSHILKSYNILDPRRLEELASRISFRNGNTGRELSILTCPCDILVGYFDVAGLAVDTTAAY